MGPYLPRAGLACPAMTLTRDRLELEARGEGEFWASVWDWASNLPDQIGDAWDSVTETAQALWENRDQLIGLLKALAEGAVRDFQMGMEALLRVLQPFPILSDIAETVRLLVQQSAEWIGGMIELARQKPEVLKAIGATALSVVMATTPNFWADMTGMGAGFLLPEIILAILFAIIAFFTAGTGGVFLAARLTAFVSKVVAKLRKAGRAGAAIAQMFTSLEDLRDKMGDLVRVLKRNVAEEAKGATDEVIDIKRPSSGFSGSRGHPLEQPKYQPNRNLPKTIDGRKYSGHALDQMQNRGVPPSVVEDALRPENLVGPGNRPDTLVYSSISNGVRVVTNGAGDVVTVITGPRR